MAKFTRRIASAGLAAAAATGIVVATAGAASASPVAYYRTYSECASVGQMYVHYTSATSYNCKWTGYDAGYALYINYDA
ncbi:hypothetical protein [Yinghuangia seranimata]|uniref:hypothetical protein n=1 Tax=Yinghuangia seranimata TaxID=408067 RepID=UPI00248ABC57|nr:hypothetical protein [Yinghuangia seranimata]MDI2132593.1 hypothetical protein [Yinghuangia seranimata]